MYYSQERREAVVRRMLSGTISMMALARETGIADSTLYRWREEIRGKGGTVNTPKPSGDKLSSAQKLAIYTTEYRTQAVQLALA